MANSLSGCSRAARDFLGMSCVLERVVPHPEGFVCLLTGNSSDFAPQPRVAGNLHVRGSCKLHGPKTKVDQQFVPQNFISLISRHLMQKTGYEAGTGIVRLLSKASNTSFSRHIKTGCHLPVCITSFNGLFQTDFKTPGFKVGLGIWEFCAISCRLISKIRFPYPISVADAICGTRFDLRNSKRRALEN